MPQGRLRRPHRHEIRVLPRRRRRLCRRKPEAAPTRAWRRGALRQGGRAGARHQRADDPRPRRAHATRKPPCSRWRRFEALLRHDGRAGRLRRRGHPGPSRRWRPMEHVHHAGNSSGIVDGAAAVLDGVPRGWGRRAGLKPRARIRGFANIGSDPALMLTGPGRRHQEAAGPHRHEPRRHRPVRGQRGLRRRGAALPARPSISPVEIASTSTAAPSRSAIPLGATGAMLLGTALDELERSGRATALVTLCIGAGMGTATIIERI